MVGLVTASSNFFIFFAAISLLNVLSISLMTAVAAVAPDLRV